MERPGHGRVRLDAAINRKDNLFIGEATWKQVAFHFAPSQFGIGKSGRGEGSTPALLPRLLSFFEEFLGNLRQLLANLGR
jgi:hypothetical protein